ncbi:MAG: carboxypeptidase-like regulatory domain-containing protein, partial [Mariprofundales bacterium]
ISGTTFNTDPIARAIGDVTITVTGASGEVFTTTSSAAVDTYGQYSIAVPAGGYSLKAEKFPRYAPQARNATLTSNPDGTVKPLPAPIDFNLPVATVADIKKELIAVATKTGKFGLFNTFSKESASIVAWTKAIPDINASDAQYEGMSRLLQSQTVLDQSNGYANQDITDIGSGVVAIALGILDIAGVLDGIADSIKSIANKLPTAWAKTTWFGKISITIPGADTAKRFLLSIGAKITKMSAKLATTAIDLVQAFVKSNNVKLILDVAKDIITSQAGNDANSTQKSIIGKAGALVAKLLLDPAYGKVVRIEINKNFTTSKGITITTSNLITMSRAIQASKKQLLVVESNFKTLKSRRAKADTAQAVLGFVINIVEILDLGKQTKSVVIGKIVAAIPILGQIQASAQTIVKVLKSADIGVKAIQLGLSVNH